MPIWQTDVTKIEKTENGFQAKPPDEKGGWIPIGVHDGHVVWRTQLFDKADLESGHAKAALYEALLETVMQEQADSLAAVVEERLAEALKRASDSERAAEHFRQRLLALEGDPSRVPAQAKGVLYMRGYQSGRRAGKSPPHEDIVLTLHALVEESRPPLLEGIA